MAITPPPTLGYGQRAEAPIDAVNQWMRTQPWYQTLIKSFGQDLNNVHLTDNQKQQVIRAAQANGVVVDEGHDGQEVDDSGNFHAKSHALRNTLIVAGIAAAALATAGAAGVFGGGAAAGSGAAGAGTGTLATTQTVPLVGSLAGGAGAATGAGLGAAGAGAAAGGAGAAWDAAGNFIGNSTVTSGAGAGVGTGITGTDVLRYGLPTAANIAGGIIQAKSSSAAQADQRAYLEEALAYEKQQDALKQTNLETARATEAGRYGDYTGNVAPFIASGQGANARMASLLGVMPTATAAATTARYTPGPTTTVAPTQTTQQQGLPRSPDQTQMGTQPVPLVTMQAPNGSQKQVPADQVPHYTQLGAKVIGASA